LESKSSAYDKLSEELSATHKKTVELRRELSTAEQNLQSANSASASSRFREQSLQQELDLTKKNNEYFETELKAKSAEYLKFRKEKSARISELQREIEEASTTIDSLRRNEHALKSRLDDVEQKYEEALAQMQSIKEESISTAEQLRSELESTNRLAELQGVAATTAKQRVQECQLSLEKARDDAAEEISRLRVEIETEHTDKEAAERKVAELEARISHLESGSVMSPGPGPNGNGPSTPIRPGTPLGAFSPRTSKGKGSLTLTQMYSEYDRMRTMLTAEQRNNAELKAALDDMVQDLESSKPEIDELRADHARLENAVMDMSNILETSGKERDEATREARKWRGQVEGLAKEGEILRQQLRDLSAQVKVLVLEVTLVKEGETEYDREELEKIARDEIDESMTDLTATGRFITHNLTTFKDLRELQEQNVTLRRMLREIGDRMESAEARERDTTYQQEQEELKELRIRVQTYRDEIANLTAQTKSYVKERDTFRSMLMRRGQTSGDTSIFSQSVPLGSAPPTISQQTSDGTDYAELLRKVQAHFDTFRQESATDHSALKQQVNELSRKNSELLSEASRLNSQLGAAVQRAELLQNNFNMLKSENTEIQKRYSTLSENANRQDIRTQQAAEDLVEAKGLADSLQRESANLKAEKDLWKNIEKRLIEDNESLRNERARLDSLNANLQNILNEREHTDAESRRRLHQSVESLESELQSTKRKLNDEIEDAKRAALRREYEHEQSQKRIDDLVTSLSSVREELISTKTTRDHLQSRVDELTVEYRSAEERLQVLQSKPSSAPAPTATTEVSTETGDSSGLTREQELAIEVSELKRDLELARSELEHAKEQVEDYKAISQATEERLQSVTETQEQYREDTERLVEEKDKLIQELEKRVEEISSELSTTNSELSTLRDEQSDYSRRLEEQKATYDSDITRLKEESTRQIAAAHFHQEDLKKQAEIAQDAQQSYEDELVKHAEAAKQLQVVRAEANQLRLEMVDVKTQAENLKKDLLQKEESWKELKDRYEREISELQKRREEVLHQNSLLHTQLENITKQISNLQKDRANMAETEETEGTSSSLESLQEVIKYLRREKEIVDVQYHLSTQESKRLRQQLEYTQSQLDETRLKLEQQRRAAADSDHHTLNHNKLMETLNELNLFRESSVTLRNQAKQAETALAEKTARVEQLVQQMEPLETRIRELENLVETKDEEMTLVQADRDRWQQRTENILQKYDRVDPAEMEALKEKLATLEKERDEAVSARDTLQAEVAAFPEQIKQTREDLKNKLTDQFKARSKELSGRINAKQAELNAVQQEKEVIKEELRTTHEELNLLKSKSTEASPTPIEVDSSTATQPTTQPTTQPPASPSQSDDDKIKALEEKVVRLEAALAEKEAQFNTKLKERSDKMKEMYNSKISELQNSHKQEIEQLKSEQRPASEPSLSAATAAPPATPSKKDEGELPELTDLQARDLVAKNKTIQSIVRHNVQTHITKLKQQMQQEAQTSGPNAEAVTDMEKLLEDEKERVKKACDEATEEKVKSAIELTDKKSAVKVSMLEARFKNANAKLQVVQKAATETPEKPVGEVWENAKDAKAPPATPATKPVAAAGPVVATQPTKQPPAAASAPSTAEGQQQQVAAPVSAPTQHPRQENGETQQQGSAQANNAPPQVPSAQAQENQQPASLPNKPPAGAIGNHPDAGTGPAALRALQSGLPVARGRGGGRGGRGGGQQHNSPGSQPNDQQQQQDGQNQRGTNLPRGRGGRGRGGQQHIQTGAAQGQGTGPASPGGGRGGMNAQARQFIPGGGNKRAREDGGEAGGEGGGNSGKRMRGGQNRGS
jgi:nucleoprotein TPR